MALLATLACFAAIAGQLVRLAARAPPEIRVAMAEPLARTFARPDIVDRAGRLIAADVAVH
jgi:cell division protein FtsI (penicillin-binding protein 3)